MKNVYNPRRVILKGLPTAAGLFEFYTEIIERYRAANKNRWPDSLFLRYGFAGDESAKEPKEFWLVAEVTDTNREEINSLKQLAGV